MIRIDDKSHQVLDPYDQLLVQVVLRAGADQLLNQRRQPLSENHIGRLGVLMKIIVKQLNDEGEFLKSEFLRASLVSGRFAALYLLKQRLQLLPLLRRQSRALLQQRLKIIAKTQNDLFGLGMRVELGVRRYVIEQSKGFLTEIPHDTFPGQLAFDETAVGTGGPR